MASSDQPVAGVQLDPADTRITLRNSGSEPIDLSGWKLRVGDARVTLPANSRIAAGATITMHTASGTSTAEDIYLGGEASALLSAVQPGATVAIENAQGQTITRFEIPRP